MRRHKRVSLGLATLALAAAAAAALLLAFATGGNAASNNTCAQLSSTQANCLGVSVAPIVLSSNQTGLIVAKFKNTFANATATHTVVRVTLPKIVNDQPATPVQATAISVSASPTTPCSQPPSPPPFTQTVSCNFGSVPGGATVVMFVQFQLTAAGAALSTLDPVLATVSLDESNGNTGTTTNDTFKTYSDQAGTQIAAPIINGAGGAQGGLCPTNVADTGFTTTAGDGQQANVSDLPGATQAGFPCTPVSAGIRQPTPSELSACGGVSCPTPIAFVFFPVLADNATTTVTLNYPTLPKGISSWQKTPLFEFLPPGETLVQLVNCGVTPNPSPDTCITTLAKYGSKGVQFTLSVAGSPFDGRYTP